MSSPQKQPTNESAADGAPGWRAVCRQAAHAAAEAEARAQWRVDADAPIPFNHRWEHVLHVVGLARWLAAQTGADPEIAEAAAWLHDVRKAEPDHALHGAKAARDILTGTDFPAAKIATVAEAIRLHEGLTRDEKTPLTPLEAAVLWDADKLSKIGVQALMYALSTRHASGRTLEERRRRNQAFLDDVLTQTAADMNTAPARTLAAQRLEQNRLVMRWWADDEARVTQHLP